MVTSMYEELNINKKWIINTEIIKEKMEKKFNQKGLWNFKDDIHEHNMGLLITKWQIKFNNPIQKKAKALKKCKFCGKEIMKWSHYTLCEKMPCEILEAKNELRNVIEYNNVEFNL